MIDVLIVEDEPLLVELMEMVCAQEGATFTSVSTLAEAALIRDEFSLVMMDFNLPDGDTLELTEKMHTERPNTILIAGSAQEHNRSRQVGAGCTVEIDEKDEMHNTLRKMIREMRLKVAA